MKRDISLLDRVEVITIDGYTDDEKVEIARDHIVPRLQSRIGLKEDEVDLGDDVIARVIDEWTREAGVRGLERALDKIFRKIAWPAVINNPLSDVTDKNNNGIGDAMA